MEKIVLTGDRPTGPLHLGHLVGSIETRLSLQQSGLPCYYMIADMQALTDNMDNPKKVRDNVKEVALDNLACGLDPNKTTFFVQSEIPEISELALLFLNLVTLARLKRNPTVKAEMKQKGYGADVPAGFLMYPISQAADILSFKANLIPVGKDQLPVIEQANEIVQKFNYHYANNDLLKTVFTKIEYSLSKTPRLKGLNGTSKMSKSLNNAIYLSDNRETLKEKVMSMYTDPQHIRIEDKGETKGNTVFEYLSIFDIEQGSLKELKRNYKKGGIGDVSVKNRLFDVLERKLEPIRNKRKEYSEAQVLEILKVGTEKARDIAKQTLNEVKSAMQINYFKN